MLDDKLPGMMHRQFYFYSFVNQERYFATMGTLLPTPNAFGEMRMMGQNWLRLYSLQLSSHSIFASIGCVPAMLRYNFTTSLTGIYAGFELNFVYLPA